MPGIYFEEYQIGQTFRTPTRTITETDVVYFSAMSGDMNELHTSEEFAKGSPFGKRLAQGLLGLSISHGLMFRLGLFDGTGIALLNIDQWKFTAPIFFRGYDSRDRYGAGENRKQEQTRPGDYSFFCEAG